MIRWFWNRPAPRAEFHAELLAAWFANAAQTGIPRGLTWVSYSDVGEVVWAKVAFDGQLLALVSTIVQFDPIAGEALDDVPQAREPRVVVVVFRWIKSRWIADARALFNLTPAQLIERSGGSWIRTDR